MAGPNTQIKYRKYIPAGGKSNHIKWSPREKKVNQIQIKYRPKKPKWDQMAARGEPRHLAV
jgi:hypothetical protein